MNIEETLVNIECTLTVLKEEIAILRHHHLEQHCTIPEILEYLDKQIENKSRRLLPPS